MINLNHNKLLALAISSSSLIHGLSYADTVHTPLSDPENSAGWIFNETLSDEFEGTSLDNEKWFVQGTNDGYLSWKGRAPSQFVPHNVSLEDGKLIIKTQWEPDYNFTTDLQGGNRYENITTAGIIHRKRMLYGYMEVRVKVPDAPMSGSFWLTGQDSELDVFEHFGKVTTGNVNAEKRIWTSIHDWRVDRPAPQDKNKTFFHQIPLNVRVADNFQTYGLAWNKDSFTVYYNGEELYTAQQGEAGCTGGTNVSANNTPLDCLGDKWLLNNPMEMWFDSEVFSWLGVPSESDLPADYEVEYVRVWQKPNNHMIDQAFFGFEGPIFMNDNNIVDVPKPQGPSGLRQYWWIDNAHKTNLNVTNYADFKFSTGRKSLKFTHDDALAQDVRAFSPKGSIQTEAGDYILSFDVFIEENSTATEILIELDQPNISLIFDISDTATGEWVTLSQAIVRDSMSGEDDRMRIIMKSEAAASGTSTLYIDNVMLDVDAPLPESEMPAPESETPEPEPEMPEPEPEMPEPEVPETPTPENPAAETPAESSNSGGSMLWLLALMTGGLLRSRRK